MSNNGNLSVIIVNWNTKALLQNCLRSLLAAEGYIPETIVVDNASTDGSSEMVVREFSQVKLIRNSANVGFSTASNQGIRASTRRYVLLLNSDTIVPEGAPEKLTRFIDDHPEAGACGPRLVRPDGTPQPYAFGGDPTLGYLLARGLNRQLLHRYLHDWATDTVQEVDWVSGACLMMRREAIDQVGLLDENIFMYFEDNDWCLRIRQAGWKVYYNPKVEIVHLGGQSLAQNPEAQRAYYRSLDYFYRKHYGPVPWLMLQVMLPLYRQFMQAV